MIFDELKIRIVDFTLRTDMDNVLPFLISSGQKTLERGVSNPKTGRQIVLRPHSMFKNPKPLSTPVNAAFTSGAGTLGAGTYYYRVAAIDIFGGVTLASTETSLVLGATGGVNVNWTKVTDAVGYKVYGRSTGAELLIATAGDVSTYLDGGSITPAGALPVKNTTCLLLMDTNSIPVPSDYIELSYLGLKDGNTILPAMERYGSRKTGEIGINRATTNKARPYTFDREENSFLLGSYADKDYTINMGYFRALPALSSTNTTNWWSLNAEQALLYAALVEAIPYLGDDPRGPVWFSKLIVEMEKLESEQNREGFSGKRIRDINTAPYLGS